MSAVAGVDDRNRRNGAGYHRSAFFVMTHSTDISVTGNHTNRIGNTFPLGCGTAGRGRKTENAASKIDHGSFKTETGSCAWFIEQSGKFFAVARVRVFLRMVFNVDSQIQKLVELFDTEIQRTH